MKIRSDFVTNSSSSSFILGKTGDNLSIESVFQTMRETYTRLKGIWEDFKRDYGYTDNQFDYDKLKDYMFMQYRNFLSSSGVEVSDIEYSSDIDAYVLRDEYTPSWIKYDTYKDYMEAVHNNKETYMFSIHDTADPTPDDDYTTLSIVDWYDSYDEFCGTKSARAEKPGEFKVPKSGTNISSMGHILIASECGNLPNCVVYKLADLSNYACNHMG